MPRAYHPGRLGWLFLWLSGWMSLASAQTADVAAAQYSESDYVERPVASPRSGYSPGGTSLAVTLSTATPGATIHYTLDMSLPDPGKNTLIYAGPIILTRTTVVKAAAVKDGMIKSSVVAETYYFLEPLSLSAPSASLRPLGARFHPRWAWEREGRRLDGSRR